ncbi:hypothetical protein LV476_09360 [Guyparkeria hydrothermalis]|uniref:hypothetical protein n=1 Tax=Guyparkeria hydrothermalis TaxID=923 RepID=UPI002021083D|nr:hypothetical protein [Guyparkeria hydrothermalis]MCL7745141.1 hypothetical protein [Guyparkeria hydrothermalis]
MKPLTHLNRLLATVAIVFAATAATSVVQAQTEDSATHQSVHGLTQNQVIARFGEPVKRFAAVPAQGEHPTPPIIRWDYADFSIYFEKTIALHRVEHGKFPPQ